MLRAFGAPSLYIQGPGALGGLTEVVRGFGPRAFAVVDPLAAELIGAELEAQLASIDAGSRLSRFAGECTAEEIARLAAECHEARPDVILGVGGGKAIDTAKGVQIETGLPIVIVPTIASNDSPTSRICVVYAPDHTLTEVRRMRTNPAAVLVDTEILVRAPARFFVSGIGDALTKRFEAQACRDAGGQNFYGQCPPDVARLLANACYETILDHSEEALAAIRRQQVDDAFERTVEATILLSGLAFENGGLSIPHSLTRGLSAVPELAGALHGEQVAFGLIVHLILDERKQAELERVVDFYGRVGLPRSLGELGYSGDPADIAGRIAQVTVEQGPYIRNFPTPVTRDALEAALLRAKALGGAPAAGGD